VAATEDLARDRGVDDMFLLTETAGEWFPKLGYQPEQREATPEPMRLSPEFTGACPESAALFRKRLRRAATAR
jgi:amino-acid N-acetyltransferase